MIWAGRMTLTRRRMRFSILIPVTCNLNMCALVHGDPDYTHHHVTTMAIRSLGFPSALR